MTTALSYYMMPYKASGPGFVDSVYGVPIIVNPYAPPDTILIFQRRIVTDNIDTLLMTFLLDEVRKEARNIVRRKTKERFPWLRV